MGDDGAGDETVPTPGRWLPYAFIGFGLPVGLLVVFLQPAPWSAANFLIGGAFLAVAVGSVTHLIASHSGPGERGPDF